MSNKSGADALFLALVIVSLATALIGDSVAAAIVFFTLIADDSFDRWRGVK